MTLYLLSTEANAVETLGTLRAVLVYFEYWYFICITQPCGKSITHCKAVKAHVTSTANNIGDVQKRKQLHVRFMKLADGSRYQRV